MPWMFHLGDEEETDDDHRVTDGDDSCHETDGGDGRSETDGGHHEAGEEDEATVDAVSKLRVARLG